MLYSLQFDSGMQSEGNLQLREMYLCGHQLEINEKYHFCVVKCFVYVYRG
jgi:hypothetical protein